MPHTTIVFMMLRTTTHFEGQISITALEKSILAGLKMKKVGVFSVFLEDKSTERIFR